MRSAMVGGRRRRTYRGDGAGAGPGTGMEAAGIRPSARLEGRESRTSRAAGRAAIPRSTARTTRRWRSGPAWRPATAAPSCSSLPAIARSSSPTATTRRGCEADDTRVHRLVDWWPEHRLYVVLVGLYEESVAYLVSERDGRTFGATAPPVLSPSGRQAVALVSNLMSGVDLEIIDLSRNPPTLHQGGRRCRTAAAPGRIRSCGRYPSGPTTARDVRRRIAPARGQAQHQAASADRGRQGPMAMLRPRRDEP